MATSANNITCPDLQNLFSNAALVSGFPLLNMAPTVPQTQDLSQGINLFNALYAANLNNNALANLLNNPIDTTGLIPGAISSRTLEQYETPIKSRPIKGVVDHNASISSDYGSMQGTPMNKMSTPMTDKSPFNSSLSNSMTSSATESPEQYANSSGRFITRTPSPCNIYEGLSSESSGISTDTSGLSDAGLLELMTSLGISPPPQMPAPTVTNTPQMPSPVQLPHGPTDFVRAVTQNHSFDLGSQGQVFAGQTPMYRTEPSPSAIMEFLKDKNITDVNQLFMTNSDPSSIERAAKLYRNAAAICDASCTWSGQLPPKICKNPTYSCKVFLGGVPWDITETGLQNCFKPFGPVSIEWPGKDNRHPRCPSKGIRGYVYVLFESEKSVKGLLSACTHDFSNGGEYYFKISSRRMRSKEVQVIPWVLSDSNYVRQASQRLDSSKTVFVGALHGMINAEALATIMNDLFANVVYAGIDTDKHKYPIGSGRVTFSSQKSYMKAVSAAFVEIKTPKFTKKVQIDPYLEDSLCSSCGRTQGPYFCRDIQCFRYYCRSCWQWQHAVESLKSHKPLMRNSRTTLK